MRSLFARFNVVLFLGFGLVLVQLGVIGGFWEKSLKVQAKGFQAIPLSVVIQSDTAGPGQIEPEDPIIFTPDTSIVQQQELLVFLFNHFQEEGPYDIYLRSVSNEDVKYRIFSNVETDFFGSAGIFCLVSISVSPGLYTLYSTYSGEEGVLAEDVSQVEVISIGIPELAITKSGPTSVLAGEPITYTLSLTNSGPVTATNLVITDRIPTDAYYISGGARIDGVVSWTVPELAANGGMTQVSFIITATHNVTNSDYRVQASGGYSASGNVTISTIVELPEPYIFIPGGYLWPTGWTITIQVKDHKASTLYDIRVEQGPVNSPTFSEPIGMSTFTTDQSGTSMISFTIPLTYSGVYTIRTFEQGMSSEVASTLLKIVPNPSISIDGGNRWPPNSRIVIHLENHVSSSPYEVWMDKSGPCEIYLGTVTVDVHGEGNITFTIPSTIPVKMEPGYDLVSYFAGAKVAITELEIAQFVFFPVILKQ